MPLIGVDRCMQAFSAITPALGIGAAMGTLIAHGMQSLAAVITPGSPVAISSSTYAMVGAAAMLSSFVRYKWVSSSAQRVTLPAKVVECVHSSVAPIWIYVRGMCRIHANTGGHSTAPTCYSRVHWCLHNLLTSKTHVKWVFISCFRRQVRITRL